MDSWWELGEWSGFWGNSLDTSNITCPFCMESGNFQVEHHAEKKKANSSKKLNFDTLKCGNCSGYVMACWSAGEYSSGQSRHDYRVLPAPLQLQRYPEYLPDIVGRHWLQSKRSLSGENWDAAVVMARSALQAALRDKGASGKNLKQEIDDLASRGLLPPIMKAWSHEIRNLGNDAAHPAETQDPASPQQASELVRFLDFFLECSYSLPHRIDQYRSRRQNQSAGKPPTDSSPNVPVSLSDIPGGESQ